MATQNFTVETPVPGITIVTWLLTGSDDGTPFVMSFAADASIQIEGDFGAGNVIIEGSNFKDGSAYRTLNDAQGNPLTFTFGKIEQLLETIYQIRPKAAGVNSVSVKLFMRQSY